MTTHRTIKYLVVHCTATSPSASVVSLQRYWRQKLGWKSPGYHFVVEPNGHVEALLPTSRVANGAKGFNAVSIHMAYIGGLSPSGRGSDTRTDAQRRSLRTLLTRLHAQFPAARILGHRDLSPDRNGNGRIDPWEWIKECPCFNAQEEYADI